MERCPLSSEAVRTGCFFYAGDQTNHHISMWNVDKCEANFGLILCALARSHGFAASEIREIQKLIVDNQQHLLDSWNEFFNGLKHSCQRPPALRSTKILYALSCPMVVRFPCLLLGIRVYRTAHPKSVIIGD